MAATKKDFKSPLNFFITGHEKASDEDEATVTQEMEAIPESETITASTVEVEQLSDVKTSPRKKLLEMGSSDEYPRYNRPGRPRREASVNRSKHFSLVMQPRLFDAITKIARMEGSNPTNVINAVLEKYVATKSALIAKHDTIFDSTGKPKI